MIDLGPHAVFIVCAYLGVAVAVAGLIGWRLLEARRISARLAELEVGSPRKGSNA